MKKELIVRLGESERRALFGIVACLDAVYLIAGVGVGFYIGGLLGAALLPIVVTWVCGSVEISVRKKEGIQRDDTP